MYAYSFMKYNKKAEEIGGDYWEFLEATTEIIKRDDIHLNFISSVIKEINNESLKLKIKEKLFNLILENGINFNGVNESLDMFSSEEIKFLLEHEFSQENIEKYFLDPMFISLLDKPKDNNWKYLMFVKIIEVIKNYPNGHALVNFLEKNKADSEIYKKIIDSYYDYLPDAYKNFLKMKQDSYYAYNKMQQFMSEDMDIGIDPRISIGPEIEANNDYGLQLDLSGQFGFEEYNAYSDPTVTDGIEVSPQIPFHNIKEDVAKFCGICETMKDIGYFYSEVRHNASGQINLGLDYLDTKEAILNFYEIYGNCEELLYYICNGDGQLFRQNIYNNSRVKPISESIGKRALDELLSREDVIKLFNVENNETNERNTKNSIKGLLYKRNSVCLRGTSDESYRLEFRIPNGGCNYRTWLDNIRLFGKMMEVAKRLADMMKKDYLLKEEEQLLKLKIDLQDSTLSLEEKLFILMELLFEDENIKQIYYDRYKVTVKKIEETNSDAYKNDNNNNQTAFAEVEFLEKYTSRINPDYDGPEVIEYDPECGFIKR